MIFVGGVPFSASSSQGSDTLVALMEHPVLVSASNNFRAIPEKKFSVFKDPDLETSTSSKCVYLFQREYATVDPALVDLVGTDEATTCVGLVIRNRKSGLISVAHMDSSIIVDIGITQMLSLLVDLNLNDELDVHLIGAFEDVLPKQANRNTRSKSSAKMDGYSFPLCTKIVDILRRRPEKFHIQTLFVLQHNTRRDSAGNAYPIFHGLLVETSTGSLIPASFDRTSRCPDEIVRRIRVTASYEDPSWNGKLLETYDTSTDHFKIAPSCWTIQQLHIALALRELTDSEILHECSTSPSAESSEFVENERRKWEYIIKQPDWRKAFPKKQPRVFERTAIGGWRRC